MHASGAALCTARKTERVKENEDSIASSATDGAERWCGKGRVKSGGEYSWGIFGRGTWLDGKECLGLAAPQRA